MIVQRTAEQIAATDALYYAVFTSPITYAIGIVGVVTFLLCDGFIAQGRDKTITWSQVFWASFFAFVPVVNSILVFCFAFMQMIAFIMEAVAWFDRKINKPVFRTPTA